MKTILAIALTTLSTISLAQDWGNWINVGSGIEVSFKVGKEPCKFANTRARLRNGSSTTYKEVKVSFSTNCDGGSASVDAYNFAPGTIKESAGDWYSTNLRPTNIRLTKLTDSQNNLINGGSGGSSRPTNLGGTVSLEGDNVVNPTNQQNNAQQRAREQQALNQQINQQRQAAQEQRAQQEQQRSENQRRQAESDRQQQEQRNFQIQQRQAEQARRFETEQQANRDQQQERENAINAVGSIIERNMREKQEREEQKRQEKKEEQRRQRQVTSNNQSNTNNVRESAENTAFPIYKENGDLDHVQAYFNTLEVSLNLAPQGDAQSQAELITRYFHGHGVMQNYTEAVKWYKIAIERVLKKDKGNKYNIDELKLMAERGNSEAQNEMGELYYYGKIVSQSFIEAAKWYRKAAEQGDISGQNNLAYLYRNGEGVAKDFSEAAKWYQKVAEQGDAYSQFYMGLIYSNGQGVTKNFVESVKWYQKAAEQDYAAAQCNLGLLYENGQGVPKSSTQAFNWYQKGASGGNVTAMNNLGNCYTNGIGVKKDLKQAQEWYRKAKIAK